jgi:hypothetical protein
MSAPLTTPSRPGAAGDGLAPEGLEHAPAVEPAFAAEAERAERDAFGREPGEAFAQCRRFEQRHVGGVLALHRVGGLEIGTACGACKVQVAAFDEADVGHLAGHLELAADAAKERQALAR